MIEDVIFPSQIEQRNVNRKINLINKAGLFCNGPHLVRGSVFTDPKKIQWFFEVYGKDGTTQLDQCSTDSYDGCVNLVYNRIAQKFGALGIPAHPPVGIMP